MFTPHSTWCDDTVVPSGIIAGSIMHAVPAQAVPYHAAGDPLGGLSKCRSLTADPLHRYGLTGPNGCC